MSGATMGLDDGSGLRYPGWQKQVQAALVEVDEERLPQQVADAEAAIFQRLQELGDALDTNQERLALEEASRSILVLKREILKFPGW